MLNNFLCMLHILFLINKIAGLIFKEQIFINKIFNDSKMKKIHLGKCFRTVASALNSLAAITCEDILQGVLKMEMPARKGAIYARWISIFFGALSFTLVFVVERLGSVLQVSISSYTILFFQNLYEVIALSNLSHKNNFPMSF